MSIAISMHGKIRLSCHSEIWHAPRQQCCRDDCQISQRLHNGEQDSGLPEHLRHDLLYHWCVKLLESQWLPFCSSAHRAYTFPTRRRCTQETHKPPNLAKSRNPNFSHFASQSLQTQSTIAALCDTSSLKKHVHYVLTVRYRDTRTAALFLEISSAIWVTYLTS